MDIVALLGSMVTISVTATGTPTPSYQWYKDGVLLTGQISPNLVIREVAPSDRGYYQCTISNDQGSVTSNEILLTIDGEKPFSTALLSYTHTSKCIIQPLIFLSIFIDVRQYITNVTYTSDNASLATLLQLVCGELYDSLSYSAHTL